MTAPPTPAVLRKRLLALAFRTGEIPEHRRTQAALAVERLEQMTGEVDAVANVW